jgi:C_GCAxxG_C_C family probable redox protein
VETLPESLKSAIQSTKERKPEDRNEAALEKFVAGYNCAQSVLYAYGPGLGLDAETSLKVATGLGAGMGRRGEVCGAVTGGILALGLKYGRGARQDRSATEETYRKTLELMARFEQRHGSCLCRVLLDGCDLCTEEGQQNYKERDLLHKTCLGCVQSVVEILAQIVDVPEARACGAIKS